MSAYTTTLHLTYLPPRPDGSGFTLTPFSSASAEHSFAHHIQPQRPVVLPIFSGNRMIGQIPTVFSYSHTPFKKSKAVLSVTEGPLKGKVIRIDANEIEEDKKRCLDLLMKTVIEPYFQKPQISAPQPSESHQLQLTRKTPRTDDDANVGDVAGDLEGFIHSGEATLEGTNALLQQGRLGTAEALHQGAKVLGNIAKGASALETLSKHAPEGLLKMSVKEGIEAIVDFAAKHLTSSGIIALASLFVPPAAPPLLIFITKNAGDSLAGEAYSRYLEEHVNEFGKDFSKFIVTLPMETLREIQRDNDSMAKFSEGLRSKMRQFFANPNRPQRNHLPLELHLTPTMRDISIREVRF